METSPLTKELYSIDWAARFEQFQQYEKLNYDDLDMLLNKIEQTIESSLENKNGIDNVESLQNRLHKAKPDSTEWHHLSMLVNLHIIKTAIPKGLTPTATLSAIQIMSHMWRTLESGLEENSSAQLRIVKSNSAPPQTQTRAPAKQNRRTKSSEKTTTNKQKKVNNSKPTRKSAAKSAVANKETAVTENVVIKSLTKEAGSEDDKPLALRCHEVANSLADEYPQYTLTAIRVMTAEKLGVTRQYVENLDIKPARFK